MARRRTSRSGCRSKAKARAPRVRARCCLVWLSHDGTAYPTPSYTGDSRRRARATREPCENHFGSFTTGRQDGEMEIGQLAPSLLALGKLVETLDQISSGEPGRVKVMVRADPKPGSFDIGLSLDFIHSVKTWLLSPDVQAVSTLVTLLGVSGGGLAAGLIQAVRLVNKRHVEKKVTLVDGNVRLEMNDGNHIVVLPAVAVAIDDVTVRQQLERFTEPLRQEGVNTIRFKDKGDVQEQITTADAPAFTASPGREPTSQATFQATYQIKRLYFERGKKWRLSNGAQTILAHIEDEVFWKRIEAAEVSFSADDYLLCEVRMDQWFDGSTGLKTEYVVVRVVKHIPAQKQDRFPGT